MPTVWLMEDDRAGNVSQLLGVAEALGWDFEEKKIEYTKWVKLPNLVRGSSTIGIKNESLDLLTAPYPDVVIGAGRRIFPLLRWIKKKSKGRTKIVQLMNPSAPFRYADLIVLPIHDGYKGSAKNVLQTVGAPHRVTREKLDEHKPKWENVLGKMPAPRVSVIVGGPTKNAPFTKQMAQSLGLGVLDLSPASIMVTTSRRTPAEVVDTLKSIFPKEKTFFYQYGDEGENPYFGLLAWADKIVVTGDSMSMCSESCAAGVPVFIFAPEGTAGQKHMRFHNQLYQGGYAMPLGSGRTAFGSPLNASTEVAEKIKSLFIEQ